MSPTLPRHPRIDALRGLALGGLLLVHVHGFVHGLDMPLSEPALPLATADRVTLGLTVLLVMSKFMPIFAALFGFSLGAMALAFGSARAGCHTRAL